MKGKRVFFLIAGSCLWVAGCQTSETPNADVRHQEVAQLIKDRVEAQEELVDILKSIADRATMKAVWPRLLKHYERSEELQKRARSLPRPEPDFLEQFRDHVSRLEAALHDQDTELRRIKGLPGGEEFQHQLDLLRQALASPSGQVGDLP